MNRRRRSHRAITNLDTSAGQLRHGADCELASSAPHQSACAGFHRLLIAVAKLVPQLSRSVVRSLRSIDGTCTDDRRGVNT